jgi:hypothetical protein
MQCRFTCHMLTLTIHIMVKENIKQSHSDQSLKVIKTDKCG